MFDLLLAAIVVFGGVLGYIPQYRRIREGKGDGFSNLVCLVLITSNIFRIYFWFGNRFDVTLVFQSIAMICAQFLLLAAWCDSHSKSKDHAASLGFDTFKELKTSSLSNFWNWDDLTSYLLVTALFCAMLTFLNYFFIQYSWYAETLGALALGIEATLGIPQLLRNYRYQSTRGLSRVLIGAWLFGDVTKVIYYAYVSTPFQFFACGFFQIAVDLLLIGQFYKYGNAVPVNLGTRAAVPQDHAEL